MCMQLMAKHVTDSIKDKTCLGYSQLGKLVEWEYYPAGGMWGKDKGFGLAVGGVCGEGTGEAVENKVGVRDTDLGIIHKQLLKP